jgi:hypothetical protein
MIGQEAGRLSASRQRAAVMLHTDTAFVQMAAGVTGNGVFQIGAARRVLAAMKENGRGDARTQEFERRWLAFAAGMLTSHSLLDRADFLIRDALTIYPRDARLYVARGVLMETRLALTPLDPKFRTQPGRDRAAQAAAADYRHAIELDPMLSMAYLRLGWLHVSTRDSRGRDSVERALAVASDPIDRYLAHLFLGGIAEREQHFEIAEREYDTARGVCPACQTPYIALTRVETVLGQQARAQALAVAFAGLVDKTDDPWWDFHLGGFDQAAVAWLRGEARSQ